MKYWTNKELARLKEVCQQPGQFALYLSEFPGRTLEALRRQAKRQGWKKGHVYPGRPPVSQECVMKLLAKRDLCRAEIARRLGIKQCTVTDVLQRLRMAGKVYVKARREGRGHTMIWSTCERGAQEILRSSPFATAAGLVTLHQGQPGRVYIHLTDSKDDEYAEAA